MAVGRQVVVTVTLLVLAARVASSPQSVRIREIRPGLTEDALLGPELKVPLSAALALRSGKQPLPRRVDVRCSARRKRYSLPPNAPVSPWFLLLVLCGDVEANPGPTCQDHSPWSNTG